MEEQTRAEREQRDKLGKEVVWPMNEASLPFCVLSEARTQGCWPVGAVKGLGGSTLKKFIWHWKQYGRYLRAHDQPPFVADPE